MNYLRKLTAETSDVRSGHTGDFYRKPRPDLIASFSRALIWCIYQLCNCNGFDFMEHMNKSLQRLVFYKIAAMNALKVFDSVEFTCIFNICLIISWNFAIERKGNKMLKRSIALCFCCILLVLENESCPFSIQSNLLQKGWIAAKYFTFVENSWHESKRKKTSLRGFLGVTV